MKIDPGKKRSIHALEAANFFLADVQTGLGPFLAAYLAGAGWQPGQVGIALTVGGVITVLLQAPAGAVVDQVRSKRLLLVLACAVLAAGAVLLSITAAPWAVYTSQALIGGAGPFLAPTLAAITMGIVGTAFFDRILSQSPVRTHKEERQPIRFALRSVRAPAGSMRSATRTTRCSPGRSTGCWARSLDQIRMGRSGDDPA